MLKGLTQKTVFYIILSNIYILIPVYELATRITSLASRFGRESKYARI